MHSSDIPDALERLLIHPGLADLGPGPREGVSSVREIGQVMDRVRTPSEVSELIRALLLLWHDHHDHAHALVQERETPDGNLIHAILHRREPDYGNASYWFHRVGEHACYDQLAKQTKAFLNKEAPSAPSHVMAIVDGDRWVPDAFIAACRQANSSRSQAAERLMLQKIQALETRVLLRYLLLSEM